MQEMRSFSGRMEGMPERVRIVSSRRSWNSFSVRGSSAASSVILSSGMRMDARSRGGGANSFPLAAGCWMASLMVLMVVPMGAFFR